MTEAQPAPERRRILPRIVALLVSISVGLFVAELVARAKFGTPLAERLPLGRIEADPDRGWRMVAGESHYTYHHMVRVNAHGLRGEEIPDAREVGERRILALGDSMIYGQGVAEADTLPFALQEELEQLEPSVRWRVMNGGHRAYATNQELALLRQLGPALDPDVVVLFWYDNDLADLDVEAASARLEASGPRPFDAAAPLEGEVLWSWKAKQVLRRSALVMYLYDRWKDGQAPVPDDEYYTHGFLRLGRHLDAFAALGSERDFTPVVAVVPHAGTVAMDGPATERAERVRTLARERGIATLELLPALRELRESTGRLPVIPYDGHYLGIANRAMARAAAAQLSSL